MPDEEFPIEESDRQVVSPFNLQPLIDEKGKPFDESIKGLLETRKTPHLKEVVECLVDEWGGAREIAKSLRETYLAAPQGSTTRSRILEKVITFMQISAEESGDIDDIDTDTLVAILKQEMTGGPAKIYLPQTGNSERPRLPHSPNGSL